MQDLFDVMGNFQGTQKVRTKVTLTNEAEIKESLMSHGDALKQ